MHRKDHRRGRSDLPGTQAALGLRTAPLRSSGGMANSWPVIGNSYAQPCGRSDAIDTSRRDVAEASAAAPNRSRRSTRISS
jgi:hypothetical protein